MPESDLIPPPDLDTDRGAAAETPRRDATPPRRPGPNRLLAVTTRVVVGVLMLVLAIGIFTALQASKPEVEVIDPAAARQTAIVFEARRVPVQRQWRGYGTAEPLNSADVPARITATVDSIPDNILPGARVDRGELLVQLDDSDFERQLEIAQQRIAELDAALAQLAVEEKRLAERLELEASDVTIAQTEYDRQLRFQERNVGTQQDLDVAQRNLINAQRSELLTREAQDLIGPRRQSLEAQISSQQAQVNLAELNRQRTTITSPIAGVLQSIDVEVGENLAAGQTIARIVAPSPIEVPVGLRAQARDSVRVGDRITLRATSRTSNATGDRVWSTTVSRISPELDADTRTLTVYADLTDADAQGGRLPSPGMFLEGRVAAAQPAPRFIVPRRAIRKGRIQVVQGGELISRPVNVAYTLSGPQPVFGLPDDQWSVIDDVLNEGDFVIVNAATQIADGTLVDPKPVRDHPTKASSGDDSPPGEAMP